MILNFTGRAKRYVQQSPACKRLSDFSQDRLVKGITRLMGEAYKDGFHEGTAQPKGAKPN